MVEEKFSIQVYKPNSVIRILQEEKRTAIIYLGSKLLWNSSGLPENIGRTPSYKSIL